MYTRSTALLTAAFLPIAGFALDGIPDWQKELPAALAGSGNQGWHASYATAMATPLTQNPSITLEPGFDHMAIQSVRTQPTGEIRWLTSEESHPVNLKPYGEINLSNSATPTPLKSKGTKAAGKAVTGQFIAKDLNVNNERLGALITISATASPDTLDVANIYEWGDNVKMAVNPSAGEITIPSQTLETNDAYGNILIVALSIQADGSISIPKDRTIHGTINDKGEVTIGPWGIVAIDEATKKATAFNLFQSSEWKVPNATFTGINASSGNTDTYPMYVEQTATNEVTAYHLISQLPATVTGRLTPAGQVVITPQQVAIHGIYGPFYIYNVNTETGKPDTTTPITITPGADGSLSFPGFYVAAQQEPSISLGAWANVKINGTYMVKFPDKIEANFQGKGTQADPWIISSYRDLTALSQAVEGGESYAGSFFALGADLDLSNVPVTEYIPVGNATVPFQGAFDGRGHTVKGLRIDGKGATYIGLFGYLGPKAKISNLRLDTFMAIGSGDEIGCVAGRCEGEISSVTVDNSILQTSGLLTGGICGALLNGKVADSSFSGRLTGIGSVAGVAGQASGSIITGCSVRMQGVIDGYISTKARDLGGLCGVFSDGELSDCVVSGYLSDNYGRSSTGGLVGRLLYRSKVSRSLNSASIYGRRLSSSYDSYAGGLFGMTVSSDVNDCMNAGTVIMAQENKNVGGIVGQISLAYQHSGEKVDMINITNFTNCYSSGQVRAVSGPVTAGIYGYAFYEEGYRDLPEDVCFHNCFYDQQVNFYPNEKFGRVTSAILGKVPAGFATDLWSVAEGQYPVLKKFNTTQAAALAQAALILEDGQDANKVKKQFTLTTPANVAWNVGGSTGQTSTSALSMSGNTVKVLNEYATELMAAGTTDGWGVKVYALAVVPKVFDGEGTAADPYILRNPADFIKLNTALTTYAQPHAGDYFALASDIDFKDTPEFKGFGFGTNISTGFGGSFDGRGHAIHNFSLKAATYTDAGVFDTKCPNGYNGLFGQLLPGAELKNLSIAADCSFDLNIYSAAMVAFNQGTITNCRNYADVLGHQRQIGGLVGVNYKGRIEECYNAGDVTGGATITGGISAYNYEAAVIRLCQNDGNISGVTVDAANAKTEKNSVGGITSDNYGTVEHCVNNGVVTGDAIIGGIAAYTVESYSTMDPNNPQKVINHTCEGIVRGCVNNGQIECATGATTIGAIVGQRMSSKEIASNYYDASVNLMGGLQSNNVEGTTGLWTSEITSGEALQLPEAAKFDFTAGRYPVLKAFAAEDASKALRAIFIGLGKQQLRTNITSEVSLSNPEGLQWKLSNAQGFAVSGSKLTVTPPEGNTVLSDTITASYTSGYAKTYAISSVPTIFQGAGTADNPYILANKEDWKKLADFVEATGWGYAFSHFRVTADINFGGDSIKPIAHSGKLFSGILDGAGHTISNYFYNNYTGFATSIKPDSAYQYVAKGTGLFGSIGSNGVVRNLTINGTFKGHSEIGGIAGNVYGTVENCINRGLVGTNSSGNVGGIAYKLWEGGVIRNCVNEGTVLPDNGKGAGQTGAAGIVYIANASTLIEGCRNKGDVGSALKSSNYGIAVTVNGTIRDCHNEKAPLGTGTMAGVCNTLGKDAIMENCSNSADFDLSALTTGGSNVFGIFNSSTGDGTGYVRNVTNTGNITTPGICSGICATLKLNASEVTNTGNIRATKTGKANGIAGTISGSQKTPITLTGFVNTGEVVGYGANTAGIVGDLAAYSTMTDSYNMGNVTMNNNGLCCAGVAAASNGRLERCWNSGDVLSWGNCTGGVSGRPGNDKTDFESGLKDCFNTGNITVTAKQTSNNAYGTVGGVVGSPMNGALTMENLYNSGTVTIDNQSGGKQKVAWAGGVIGGVLNSKTVVRNVYNAGRVVKAHPEAADEAISFTVGSSAEKYYVKPDSIPFDVLFSNVYYDKNVNPAKCDRSISGSALTTSELQAKELKGFRASDHQGYPVLEAFGESHAASALSAAMIGLKDESTEHHDNVVCFLHLIGPADAVWSETPAQGASPCFSIEGTYASPIAAGSTNLVCTSKDGLKRVFPLMVAKNFITSIDETLAGVQVESMTYFDLQGRIVAAPEKGQVYVVRTRYSDGTVRVTKVIGF